MRKEMLRPVPGFQVVIAILWPSFVVASIATVLFFVLFDPIEILHLHVSRLGAYSVGFFFFWSLTAISSLLTLYFQLPIHHIDVPPTHDDFDLEKL